MQLVSYPDNMAVSVYDLYPSLLESCGRDDVRTAEYLLNQGLDVNYIDQEGDFPLLVASTFGRVAMVKFLLDRGAKIDLENSRGESGLSVAIKNGRAEVVSLLKKRGASYRMSSEELLGQSSCTPSPMGDEPKQKRLNRKGLLSAVRELIPIADEWENIGLMLNVPVDTLSQIKFNHPSAHMRIQEVLKKWMNQELPEELSWEKLAEAVEPIDPYVAHRINKRRTN